MLKISKFAGGLALLFLLGGTSCRWGIDLEACYRLQEGDWRGLLQTEGGDLPFLFRLERQAGPNKERPSDRLFKARLQDGDTWVESSAEVRGDSLYWSFPVYESVLVAAVSNLGDSLKGFWVKTKNDTAIMMPWSAARGGQYKFASRTAGLPAEVGAQWKVDLGPGTPALMPLTQKGPEISGTLRTSTGDYRYLSGIMDGDSLWMSGMDGGSAYLIRGHLAQDGSMQGQLYAARGPGRPWTAVRDSAATLPDPYGLSTLQNAQAPLAFEFKDIQTGQVVRPGPPRPRYPGSIVGDLVPQLPGRNRIPCIRLPGMVSQRRSDHRPWL